MKINRKMPISIVKEFSFASGRSDLRGWFYNCIFDEKEGRYNTKKPHQHKIYDACYLYLPGDAYDGFCLSLSGVAGLVFACKGLDISKIKGY